ncbi:MAG: hypothetical protein WBF47_12560, partial [Xanthobacteraceae bacterium]
PIPYSFASRLSFDCVHGENLSMRRTVDHNRANIRPATADTTQVSIALQMVLMLEKVEYRLK